MMKRFLTLITLVSIPTIMVFGQLMIQAELRPRAEYRRGYRNIMATNQEDAFFVSQRSRINLYYSLPKISFGFSIQDVRVWGDEGVYTSTGVFGDNAALDLNEAWMSIILYPKGSLSIGRQFWSYEDERILSPRGWNQSQIKYNAITFKHNSASIRFDLGLSWNSSAEAITGNEYPADKMKTMNFIYLKKDILPWFSLSGMAILSGFTETDSTQALNLSATYFGYINIRHERLKATVSGSYQHGESRKGKETSAYMLSLRADYQFGKVRLGAGADYLSGNDAADKSQSYRTKEHSYDILYGARHRYYGHLDFFSSLQHATRSGGLSDIILAVSWQFVPKATLNADFHYFSLQNHVVDDSYTGTGEQYFKKGLGPEADLNLSWDILSFLNLKAGYSVMLPTATMVSLQGMQEGAAKTPQWVWMMITAKPVLLDKSN
jgi:hypothetical protein